VSGVMEELRRITTNERSENQNLCDSPDFAKNRLTANRFYSEGVLNLALQLGHSDSRRSW